MLILFTSFAFLSKLWSFSAAFCLPHLRYSAHVSIVPRSLYCLTFWQLASFIRKSVVNFAGISNSDSVFIVPIVQGKHSDVSIWSQRKSNGHIPQIFRYLFYWKYAVSLGLFTLKSDSKCRTGDSTTVCLKIWHWYSVVPCNIGPIELQIALRHHQDSGKIWFCVKTLLSFFHQVEGIVHLQISSFMCSRFFLLQVLCGYLCRLPLMARSFYGFSNRYGFSNISSTFAVFIVLTLLHDSTGRMLDVTRSLKRTWPIWLAFTQSEKPTGQTTKWDRCVSTVCGLYVFFVWGLNEFSVYHQVAANWNRWEETFTHCFWCTDYYEIVFDFTKNKQMAVWCLWIYVRGQIAPFNPL